MKLEYDCAGVCAPPSANAGTKAAFSEPEIGTEFHKQSSDASHRRQCRHQQASTQRHDSNPASLQFLTVTLFAVIVGNFCNKLDGHLVGGHTQGKLRFGVNGESTRVIEFKLSGKRSNFHNAMHRCYK